MVLNIKKGIPIHTLGDEFYFTIAAKDAIRNLRGNSIRVVLIFLKVFCEGIDILFSELLFIRIGYVSLIGSLTVLATGNICVGTAIMT